ncbi:MAG TPA: uroporphyrinogen-III synthase [Edaphobacter sp.]|nr:uroporphyrinogen-III synthase [Edaphobacter sp.]
MQLEANGATVLSIPTIEIVPPASYAPLDRALACIDDFDWIVFTSAHAVEVFGERRNPELFPKNIAVIGPATARAVEKLDLPVSLLPQRYIAESLAESLEQNAAGASILLIRAEEARDVLPSALRQAACRLTIVDAYRNRIPEESISRLRELFADPKGAPDLITFTSGSTARNLVAILEAAGRAVPSEVVLASIGPITSRTLRELGLEPTVEAAEATISALVEAILHYFEQAGQSG